MDIRVSAIEVESTPGAHITKIKGCTSLPQLGRFLDEPWGPDMSSAKRQLFIVEAPLSTPSFSQLRTLLHNKLGVPHHAFKKHRWSHTTFQFNETIDCPRLPTLTRPRKLFSMEYFELWQVLYPWGPSHTLLRSQGPTTVKCTATGRDIQCYRWKSPDRGWLLIAPRKCSFWSEKTADGWTGK